mmetsp:Transcript_25211/g.64024  ORF Transcript_25211/g.64024 Transcript_25211/m.64024 type:complete len:362 (+) Transcript_25211:276-1361(+)
MTTPGCRCEQPQPQPQLQCLHTLGSLHSGMSGVCGVSRENRVPRTSRDGSAHSCCLSWHIQAQCTGAVKVCVMPLPHTTASSFSSAVCLGKGSGRPAAVSRWLMPLNQPLRHWNSLTAVGKCATERPYASSRSTVPGARLMPSSLAPPAASSLISADTSSFRLFSTPPTFSLCLAPTTMNALIQTSFSSMACAKAVLSSTLQLSPPACSRSATACACGPYAAVRPSGLTSVFPSMGASPALATAKYTSTCVFSPRPCASSHGCSMPFWMKTKSWRRGAGVAATMLARSSLRVHTTMGPFGKPSAGDWPLRMITSPPGPISLSACPMRPPPMMVMAAIFVFVAATRTFLWAPKTFFAGVKAL